MAFITAFVLGSRLSWTLPVVFVVVIPLVGDGSGTHRWAWWAWVDQPATDPLAWALAMSFFVMGFWLACFFMVSEMPGRAE